MRSRERFGLIALAVVALGGCGEDRREAAPVAAVAPFVDLVSAIPDPFDARATQAGGTYVGAVGARRWTYVGLVVRGSRALVYLCDGKASEWFGAPVKDGRLLVESALGTVVDARVEDGAVVGTVRPAGQAAGHFDARAPGAGQGLFLGPDAGAPGHVRRWIVLADGVRGVSSPSKAIRATIAPVATATVSDGTSNTVTVVERTATPAPTATIADGTSNTIGQAERTATPARTATATIADGTSNTIGQAERTATPARTPTATISDGTSNTVIIGERTATPVATATVTDGTSNTILVGEAPVNGIATGIGTPPGPPAPVLVVCSTKAACAASAPRTPPAAAPVAGASQLDCKTLAGLISSVTPAAVRGDAAALKQLEALVSAAKAKGC